ncbi:Putative ammonia monooxygenase [Roseovarius albus]|uniref:Putative ammonia monooxygenase n=1 Tax=Roseovarius albus TaxID=1247867 RepID=A0A1X6YCV0_9RHOB|nr:AbrB family transcriptional regulator [Roseovarius albus]SLN16884.1 Putative ammonia monooxygenase [Roseovarius albus]
MPHAVTTAILIVLGSVAALGGEWLGLPLPYLIGPLVLSGLITTILPRRLPDAYHFPYWLRLIFIAVIGVMIGARITPELFALTPARIAGLTAIAIFVPLAHAYSYAIFRKLGRYDHVTSFYAGAPGGLYESLALGEEMGADMARLTLQQFLRLILVVTALPFGISLWVGSPVGSAGGMTMAEANIALTDLPPTIAVIAAGLLAGLYIPLPAKQLTAPLVLAAIVTLTGLVDLNLPQWLINVAQIVIGTALGSQFAGLNRRQLQKGILLSLVSVGGMLIMAAGFASALHHYTGQPFDALFISFSPGGVTEMALVALSLNASPTLVTLHHVWRILLTVIGLSISARMMRRQL